MEKAITYTVSVAFRKARDSSNQLKDELIAALPGPYKVKREELNDMDKGGYHPFVFANLLPARNFGRYLFENHSLILYVHTDVPPEK